MLLRFKPYLTIVVTLTESDYCFKKKIHECDTNCKDLFIAQTNLSLFFKIFYKTEDKRAKVKDTPLSPEISLGFLPL